MGRHGMELEEILKKFSEPLLNSIDSLRNEVGEVDKKIQQHIDESHKSDKETAIQLALFNDKIESITKSLSENWERTRKLEDNQNKGKGALVAVGAIASVVSGIIGGLIGIFAGK